FNLVTNLLHQHHPSYIVLQETTYGSLPDFKMGRVKATIRKKGGHTAQSMKKAMSIRQASKECNLKYPTAMTPINIINSFMKTGIFPFDQFIFTEVDFMPSTVTDSSHTLEDIENRQGEKSPSPSLLDNVDPELNDSKEDKDITPLGIVTPKSPSPSIVENNNPQLDSPDGPDSLK
ncbi:unnamed protein product, partial [Leptidea sinapis]